MAILSTAQQGLLQNTIDLMVKGTAREVPFSEDVIARLAKFINSVAGEDTSGVIYEASRDTPYSLLIAIVGEVGSPTMTTDQENRLVGAINLMRLGTAVETPFADDVIERLAPVAESSGYLTRGAFYQAVRDRPISAMLQWALFLGSK